VKRSVLITRSQPGADIMAAALGEAGYLPRIGSVIRIAAVPALVTRQTLEAYSVFIFVSAAAVRLAPGISSCLKEFEKPVIYAIGPETRRQLAHLGLSSTSSESADSEGLLSLNDLQNIDGKRILIVCGTGGREILQQQLQDRGAVVDRAEVYQRLAAEVTLENTGEIDAVIISSGDGLKFFLELDTGLPDRVPLLLPSRRVAKQARMAGVKDIIVCEGASSEAVLNKLDALFSSD